MGQITVIDISTKDEPDAPKAFKNREVYVIVAEDFQEGPSITSVEELRQETDKITASQLKINAILEELSNVEKKDEDQLQIPETDQDPG